MDVARSAQAAHRVLHVATSLFGDDRNLRKQEAIERRVETLAVPSTKIIFLRDPRMLRFKSSSMAAAGANMSAVHARTSGLDTRNSA